MLTIETGDETFGLGHQLVSPMPFRANLSLKNIFITWADIVRVASIALFISEIDVEIYLFFNKITSDIL